MILITYRASLVLLTASDEKTAIGWNTGRHHAALYVEGGCERNAFTSVAFDTRVIANGFSSFNTYDTMTTEMSTKEKKKSTIVRKFKGGHTDWIMSVSVTEDHVWMGSGDYTVIMYERKGEGKQIGTFKGHRAPVFCMCITKDRKGLITGSADQTIIHWTISNQEKVRSFRGHPGCVLSVDTYGDLLVSGGGDMKLILWSISKGDRLRDLRGHTSWVYCVRFSSFDGKSVFSGSADETVIRWKVSDGAQIMKYEGGHTRGVTSLAVTRDDSKLITGSHDHTCIIWNVLSGARLNIFKGHNDRVLSVALSPCERYFASGSKDNTTRIWGIVEGKQVHVLADHRDTVNDVTFSGRHTLLTASSDQTAIEYDISFILKDIPARFALLHAFREAHVDDENPRTTPLRTSASRVFRMRDTSETRYLLCCMCRFV